MVGSLTLPTHCQNMFYFVITILKCKLDMFCYIQVVIVSNMDY